MIEVFSDVYDAILYLETHAESSDHEDDFKAELLRLDDGIWRVGITYERQLELPFLVDR